MTPSTKVLLLFASILSSLSATHAFADDSIDVAKANGAIERYKLLPVHHDEGHAAAVESRLLMQDRRAFELPSQYEISKQALPAIRDQGRRGTCAYFATVGLLEAHYMAQSPSFGSTKLSEECLVDVRNWMADKQNGYNGNDRPDERPDPNGDWPGLIIKTVSYYGVPVAKSYSSKLDCRYNGSNEKGMDLDLRDYNAVFSQNLSPAYGKDLAFQHDTGPTIESVKALIANNIPVEIGLTVYNEYMSSSNWRFDPKQDTEDNLAGGHAVILTGYSVSGDKTIFTFKNSWGKSWGQSGYGTIDDALLVHSWGYDRDYDMTVSVR